MQILRHPISVKSLSDMCEDHFSDFVKCVADVKENKLAVDSELHSDLERMLLEDGSAQENLWGFNLYPQDTGDDFIEYDSLINIRSWQGNPSRDVVDPDVREAIKEVVNKYILR